MKTGLLLLLAAPAWAAFTFTVTPNVVNINHQGARALVSTSDATTAVLLWDTTSHSSCSYPCSAYAYSDTPGSSLGTHNWLIGAMPASTVIYWRWCATDGSATGCSSEQNFTTSALPSPHPQVAALPTSTVTQITPPIQSGTTRTVGTTSGCSTLLACWNISSCGDTIIEPAATPDVGYYPLPAKVCTSSSWILIETDQYASLPAGRIGPTNIGLLASIENSAYEHYLYNTALTNGNCYPGAYWWPLTGWPTANTAGFNMNQCQANTSKTITNITGCTNAGNGNLSGCIITTSTNNGFSTSNGGDIVTVSGVVGINRVNSTCRVTAGGGASTTATLTCAASYNDGITGPYSSGGTVNNYSWVALTSGTTPALHAVTLGASPTYFPPSGSCTLGDWGYDGTHATENYDAVNGPTLGTTSTGSVVRCVENDAGTGTQWKRWTVFLGDPTNALTTNPTISLAGSSYIYLLGLRLANVPIPPEPLFLQDGGAPESVQAFQGGKAASTYLYTDTTASNIVLDRVLIDGADYPNGMVSDALTLNGSSIALINSYVRGCGYWFGSANRGSRYDDYASACILRSAGAVSLFNNNYIEAYGISLHNDDSQAGVLLNSDQTVTRNTFYRNPTHFFGNSANSSAYPSGVYWPLRQHYELKDMLRATINGNIFTNNWKNVSAAAAFEATPRMEASPWFNQYATVTGGNTITWSGIPATNLSANNWLVCTIAGLDQLYQVVTTPTANSVTVASVANGSALCARADWPYGVQDITFTNNTVSGVPNAINTFGSVNPDVTTVGNAIVSPLTRWNVVNNLCYNVIDDGTTEDPYPWQSSGGGYWWLSVSRYAYDLISNHNSCYQVGGTAEAFLGAFADTPSNALKQTGEGLQSENNLVGMAYGCAGTCAGNSPINGQSLAGNAFVSAFFASPGTTVDYNWFWMVGGTNPGGYGSNTHWLTGSTSTGFDFVNSSLGNYQLTCPGSSGCAGGGYSNDGADVGVNWAALIAAQSNPVVPTASVVSASQVTGAKTVVH